VFFVSLGVLVFGWVSSGKRLVCETGVSDFGSDQVNMYLRSIVVSLILYSYTLYNGTGMVRV